MRACAAERRAYIRRRRHTRREAERVHAAKQARRNAWVAVHGLLSWKEAEERQGPTGQELNAALETEIVRSVEDPAVEAGYAFARDKLLDVRELKPTERERITVSVDFDDKLADGFCCQPGCAALRHDLHWAASRSSCVGGIYLLHSSRDAGARGCSSRRKRPLDELKPVDRACTCAICCCPQHGGRGRALIMHEPSHAMQDYAL